MSDEAGDSAPPAKSSDAPRRQPREKTCYNCGEVSARCILGCIAVLLSSLSRHSFQQTDALTHLVPLSSIRTQTGHIARNCQNERLEGEARQKINQARTQYRRCFNCGKIGHISADCTKPAGNKACYNCGQEGHIAKDCPNPRED